MKIAVFAAVALLSGCMTVSSTNPYARFSRVRVSPMGEGQFMVSCVDSPSICADQATRLCQDGFDVVSNVVNPADFGRMTMIVKCHTAHTSAKN